MDFMWALPSTTRYMVKSGPIRRLLWEGGIALLSTSEWVHSPDILRNEDLWTAYENTMDIYVLTLQ